MYNKLIN